MIQIVWIIMFLNVYLIHLGLHGKRVYWIMSIMRVKIHI